MLSNNSSLLYFTTIILLHRPFYSSPAHHAACRKASGDIEKLLLLLERTFGFSRITYLIAYCIYTGASVTIQEMKEFTATAKLDNFLRALKHGISACPIVQRSLDIITKRLDTEATEVASKQPGCLSSEGLGYLPAFPSSDMGFDAFLNGELGPMDVDLDGFSVLDCFPEAQIDVFTSL